MMTMGWIGECAMICTNCMIVRLWMWGTIPEVGSSNVWFRGDSVSW